MKRKVATATRSQYSIHALDWIFGHDSKPIREKVICPPYRTIGARVRTGRPSPGLDIDAAGTVFS